jgi:hypothetical protein
MGKAFVKNQAKDGRGGVWLASIDKLAKDLNDAAIRDDRKNRLSGHGWPRWSLLGEHHDDCERIERSCDQG